MIRINLLDHVDRAAAANRVNAMPFFVIKNVVGVFADSNIGDKGTRVRV